jgi:hypothetical protein
VEPLTSISFEFAFFASEFLFLIYFYFINFGWVNWTEGWVLYFQPSHGVAGKSWELGA